MDIAVMQKKKERSSINERIKEFEDEVSTTKYNKKTQGHIGLVKAKIARLKEDQQRRIAGKGKTEGYAVKRSGDATAIIVGFPSVGKSTLLNSITNAKSQVAAYSFTTLTCIPGLMEYKHAKIQVLDVPGIVEGAASGRGRGREVLACAQSADLVIILLEAFHPEHLEVIEKELRGTNLRINQKPADVKISKKIRGGIDVLTTVKLTKIDKDTVKAILKEFRLENASIVMREDIDADQLIDIIEGSKKYVPSIVVLNKIDMVDKDTLAAVKGELKPDVCISAEQKVNLDELKEIIFKKLRFIRVFCKEHGQKADMGVPLIMKEDATLRDVCLKLHRNFANNFKFARIWGKSVKFGGMVVRNLEHNVKEGDVVEIRVN